MAARILFLNLTLILCAALLTACAPDHDEESTAPRASVSPGLKPAPQMAATGGVSKSQVEVPDRVKAGDWLPQKVSLTCALADCPPQVGVILFASPTTDIHYDIWRCTAFLIDNDKIMTNGHCDFSEKAEGYFVTRTDMPEKTFRRITRRLFKDFTPNPKDPEVLSGRPDVAIFQLESPILKISPLQIARGTAHAYTSLTAIVANAVPGKEALTMTIGELNCEMHRHERYFPYALSENPDVLTVFECEGEKGNSGSPMFAGKSMEVEAILEGAKDPHKSPARFSYDKHLSVEATNLRCLEYPSSTARPNCVVVRDVDKQKRFSSSVDSAIANLLKRQLPNAGAYDTGFTNFRFEMKTDPLAAGAEFELLYYPSCRRSNTIKNLIIPIEHVRLDFDQWAVPRLTSLKTTESSGKIKNQSATDVQVEMSWAPAAGILLSPEKDPRRQLGQSFSIALPPCTS
jgi:hypothetical protein